MGVAILEGDRLLLVKRAAPPGSGLWAVPGGKVRLGERLAEAAVREAREETGLEVDLGPVVWVGESIGPGEPPEWHYTLVDFLARPRGGVLRAGDDAAAVAWVRLEEVASYPTTSTMPGLVEAVRRHLGASHDGPPTEPIP